MVKVSIIVPVYNVERYLRRSIESIQRQTLQDIQIILVNDGSTDNSLSICSEYQKKDARIEVIDKSNGGVSSARNAGIQAAKGEYIGFIDPDDWIEDKMYQDMYQQVESVDADVCMCNYVIENNGKRNSVLLNIRQDMLEGQEIIHDIISDMLGSSDLNSNAHTIMGSVWRLIIKKELIDKYNVKFQLGISVMEDLLFCVQVLLETKRISINRGVYYHYMLNSNSAVSSYKDDLINILQKVYQTLEGLFTEDKLCSVIEQRLNVRYVNMFISVIANEVRKENHKNVKEKTKFINKLCKDVKLKSILKEIDTKGYTIRKRMVLKAIKYELGTYLYFYYSFLNKTSR